MLQIQRYISYASEALANGGQIELEPEGVKGQVRIEKKEFKRKPNALILTLRSGFHSRTHILHASEALSREGIEHKLSHTKKRRLPRRLFVSLPANNKMVSSSATHIIRVVYTAMGVCDINSYSITCWGPFKKGFHEADGEIIKKPLSLTVGYFLGYIIGRILRVFSGKDGT